LAAKDVIAMAQEKGILIVDLLFTDLPGLWQHFSIGVEDLNEDLFEEGIGFDGSSIRGFQKIHESDMLLVPDPDSAFVDPFLQVPTLHLICDVVDPITRENYSRDPRHVARKAENYMKTTGLADTAYFGPEAEFFIFDEVRFDQTSHSAFYSVDSIEGAWNMGRDEMLDLGKPNLGYKIRYKEGYFPVPPMDHFQDLRSEMFLTLKSVGVAC